MEEADGCGDVGRRERPRTHQDVELGTDAAAALSEALEEVAHEDARDVRPLERLAIGRRELRPAQAQERARRVTPEQPDRDERAAREPRRPPRDRSRRASTSTNAPAWRARKAVQEDHGPPVAGAVLRVGEHAPVREPDGQAPLGERAGARRRSGYRAGVARRLIGVVAVGTAALAFAQAAVGRQAGPAQVGPEYALVLSAIAGGFHATKPIFTCPGPDVAAITQAIGGPEAVEQLGVELVAHTLGTKDKPWPQNHRAFVYEGRSWTPDFVKGRTFYVVTVSPIDLVELRDLRAIARRRGGEVVVVTRRTAVVGAAVSKAASAWWKRSDGRVRVLRCI
jgi:hypothetical protein